MSKLMIAIYLVGGIGLLLGGAALGRAWGLSPFAATGGGLVPAWLLAYPVLRWWYRGRLGFTTWLLGIICIVGVATLIKTLML